MAARQSEGIVSLTRFSISGVDLCVGVDGAKDEEEEEEEEWRLSLGGVDRLLLFEIALGIYVCVWACK